MSKKISYYRNQADKLMQIAGKIKNPKCLLCGNQTQVMHHFVPKSVSSRLRYDWDNLIPLCNPCHFRLHQSGDPDYEQRIIDKKGGQEWYKNIRQRGRETIKVNILHFKEEIEKLSP